MPDLPSGTVTFLFTDIEGSTRLWEQYPETMRSALARHDALLRESIESHNGHVFKTVGDAFCAAFATASDALRSILAAQKALQQESWEEIGSLRVRMAMHTGAAEERDNDYFGPALNRVARLLSIGHGEQVLLSMPAEELVKDSLPEGCSLKDMGSHRLKDLQQPEHVFQLIAPDLPAEFPPLRSLQAFANNLPNQLTSFIGRDKEIEAVKSLLAKSRLLTLTGSGGCGKTRLALQVAADLIEEFADGVWLVELAALSDPSLLPQAVASALGVREEPGRALQQTLSDYLMQKQMLLLMDNCEHLLQACADLAQTLLKQCPHLSLLTTSREALRVAGEQVYRVPSLLAPDPTQLPKEEKELAAVVSEYEAPNLFVERASLQKADFTLTNQNAFAVAWVCHRLDGIPLAIELAAARVSALTVEEINTRLEHRFRLLRGGSRTALPRQQTLQATLDWSYDLLTEQERLLLGRLSVFAGGWGLEAAEAVCSEEPIVAFEVLELLASLVDRSLVIAAEREGKSRYRLLESIRAYAQERLQQTGEERLWRDRHLDFFLAWAEEAEPYLRGAKQAEWLERLESEQDNLRSALSWCQQDKERAEAGLRLAGFLFRFWEIRGYWSEGREYLQAALSQETAPPKTRARANALNGAGVLAYDQGDYATAHILQEESLAIYRELGDRSGIAASLNNLGNVAKEQGDYAEARVLYEESLAILRELGDKSGIAYSLSNLGNVAWRQGDVAAARALHDESLAIRRELGDKLGIAYTLEGMAALAAGQGQNERAARLWVTAEVLREAIHSPLSPKEKEAHDRKVATARASLGEEAFAAAWEAGRAMTLEQAIEYALQEGQQESKEHRVE